MPTSGHSWPWQYYQNTINNPNYDSGYGFPLAIEQSAFAQMWVSVSGTTNIDTYRPGVSVVDSGPFKWYSGILSGTLGNGSGQFVISNSTSRSAPVMQNALLVNAAKITQNAGATLTLSNGAIDNRAGAVWETLGAGQITGSGTFTNSGVFGSNSSGQFVVGSGVKFFTTGTVVIGDGGRLTLNGGGAFTNSALAAGTGATLELGGLFNANFINLSIAGALTINETGTLTVSGNYAQGSGATLNLTAGAAPSLLVGGSASLDGTLNISGVSGQSGTATLLRASGGISGDFTTIGGISSGSLDYLQLGTTVSGNDYLLNYGLTWFASANAHGNFTISDGASFEVGTPLTTQAPAGAWDGNSLAKHGGGTLILSAVNTYTGNTVINSGALKLAVSDAIRNSNAVTVSPAATLSLGGFNQTIGALDNRGLVDFVNLGRRLTVSGNLTGSGAFRMDVDIAAHLADVLDVQGDALGAHTLLLTNHGTAPTGSEDPLMVVTTLGGDGTFSGTVSAGLYDYSVFNGAALNLGANDWFLDVSGTVSDSGTTPGSNVTPPPPAPTVSAAGSVLASAVAVKHSMWFAQQNSLVKRMGDIRLREEVADAQPAKPAADSEPSPLDNVWLRGYGQQLNVSASVTGRAYKQYIYGTDLGIDGKWTLDATNALYTGFFAGYGRSDLDYRIAGTSGELQSLHGGVYATWLNNSGWYVDATFKAARIEHKMSVDDLRAKYNDANAGGSVEFGKRFKLGGGWFAEPQAQVSYLHNFARDYAAGPLTISTGDLDAFQFRIGALFGNTIKLANGGALQPYLKVSGVELASHGGDIRSGNQSVRASLDGARLELGGGVIWQLDWNNQLHLDYEASFGDNYDKLWGLTAGYRHQF